MSDGRSRNATDGMGQSRAKRAQLPLLDRLVDADPAEKSDRPLSAGAAMDAVRISICNDLEELFDAL